MNDSILEKYIARRDTEPAAVETEPMDNVGAFGWLRGIRDRAIMLELLLKDGSITALDYHLLQRADFNPSDGITLHFGQTVVKITGGNLNAESPRGARLFTGIVRHRVPWVKELDEPAAVEVPKGATVIEAIRID